MQSYSVHFNYAGTESKQPAPQKKRNRLYHRWIEFIKQKTLLSRSIL